MPDLADKPIRVSENAGIIDLLTAAGRYLVVIGGTIPLLLALLKARDFSAIVAFFQSNEGVSVLTAITSLFALAWGLWKTHRRGAQIATVAVDPRVPDRIATTK